MTLCIHTMIQVNCGLLFFKSFVTAYAGWQAHLSVLLHDKLIEVVRPVSVSQKVMKCSHYGPICFHSWGQFGKQTDSVQHIENSQLWTRGMNKEKVNDACYSEKRNTWCTETESTFELLQSREKTANACPHCADSLPYISQSLKTHLEINSSSIRPQSANGKRLHKWTTHCTSIWFGRILFQSCRPHFICHCFPQLISLLVNCSA